MRRYSLEYVDVDGDVVIKSAEMTQSEALKLIQSFAERGISAKIYDITPPQVDEAAQFPCHAELPAHDRDP